MVLVLATDFRERVRRAIGAPFLRASHDLVVRGRVEESEMVNAFTWRFGEQSRFERKTTGALEQHVVSDGRTTWLRDAAGRTREMVLGEVDTARLLMAVLSGEWLEPQSGIAATEDSGRVRLKLGKQDPTVVLEADRPRELALRPSFGGETWTFDDYREFRGIQYPTRIEKAMPAGTRVRYIVESVDWVAAEPYVAPPATAARFDATVAPELEVMRPTTGFLLVRPKIDGQTPGWFIFDTGAGTNVITTKVADALGLTTIGKSWLGMAAGAASGAIRRAHTLSLGPLVIDAPGFVEMDLAQVSSLSGVDIVGILGYDLLMRSIVEIDVDAPRIAVHDPAHYTAATAWTPVTIYGNHVFVPGKLDGHEGLFRLDTGAPQVPIIFNGPVVQELRLLEGRQTTNAKIGVPGGDMDVAMGPVEGLEIAGHRYGKLNAIFPLGSGGAFDDRYTLGNLGQECLRPFRAVFDLARQRVAFIEKASD